MSDPSNPYGSNDPSGSEGSGQPPTNPYGQPPGSGSAPSPYDGQPPEYAAPQHGGPQPAGQQAYGQSPYGQQQYGAGDPNKRPGTVTAASIVTMITTGLAAIGFAFGTIAVLVARDDIVSEVRGDSNFDGLDVSGDTIATVLIVVFLVVAAWSAATFVLALLAMRGKNWARILVVISAGISALFSLLAILSIVSAVTLIAAIAVIILYFTGGANEWYRHKSSASQ